MLSWFDTIQSSLFAFKHAHHLPIDVGMYMRATFTFGQLELKRNLITLQDLTSLRGNDLDAGAFRRLQRRLGRHLLHSFHGHIHALHLILSRYGGSYG